MSDILMEKKEVRAIMWECVEKHADSLDDGVEAALSKVKKLDCFEELSDLFCSKFLRVSMGGMRHEINMEIRAAAGGFYAPAKVNPAKSKILQKIFRNAMQYQINGTILGKLVETSYLVWLRVWRSRLGDICSMQHFCVMLRSM